MTDHTIVFISGVSRGIGKALAAAYLSRPNHRVIGSIRNSSPPEGVEELSLSPTANGSSLMLVKIESTNPEDPERVLQEMIVAGVDRLDIVISNAGGSPVPPSPLESVSAEELLSVYHTNVIGPLRLFQVFKPLLQKSKTPKWIWQSSIGGSITSMAQTSSWIAPSYGASRAASNWIASLVQTPSGNWVAQQIGMEKAPITMELCVERIMTLVDGATRNKVSGKFISTVEGIELPW
ncbi:aflatoxin biosynthesis ketoreductase nor-1 [Xylaria sp. FL0043]|nr:aflatoxin biosynthesis ketoreductase nor-1 [Xylaria sp. FL0043]